MEDPTHPTIVEAYASAQQPILFPWGSSLPLPSLGAGFNTSAAHSHDPLYQTLAFDRNLLRVSDLQFKGADRAGDYNANESSNAAASSEHLSFACQASIGYEYAGATATGSYTKNVLANQDVSSDGTDR